MRFLSWIAVASLAAVCQAQAGEGEGEGEGPESPAAFENVDFSVFELDDVDDPDESAYDPLDYFGAYPRKASEQRGELLLLFPDLNTQPDEYRSFMAAAAARGFHAAGVSWSNEVSAAGLCAMDVIGCNSKVREEFVTGQKLSLMIETAVYDSIDSRVARLLTRLNESSSEGTGWGRYLTGAGDLDDEMVDAGDLVNWSRIVLAGLGDGSAYAAFIAARREVRRVLLFGGPVDTGPASDGVVEWVGEVPGGATPAARFAGFFHRRQESCERVLSNWNEMEMQGEGEADEVISEFIQTNEAAEYLDYESRSVRRFCTNLDPGGGVSGPVSFLRSLLTDAAVPEYSTGEKEYVRLWQYMLTFDPATDHDNGGERFGEDACECINVGGVGTAEIAILAVASACFVVACIAGCVMYRKKMAGADGL